MRWDPKASSLRYSSKILSTDFGAWSGASQEYLAPLRSTRHLSNKSSPVSGDTAFPKCRKRRSIPMRKPKLGSTTGEQACLAHRSEVPGTNRCQARAEVPGTKNLKSFRPSVGLSALFYVHISIDKGGIRPPVKIGGAMPRAPRFHTREQPLMELFNRVGTGCPSMPDDETFHLELVGLLVKAQEESPIPIHSGAFGARDWSLLASPQDVGRQAEFLRHFTRGLSLLIQSYKNWDGPIFPRRYRAMEISDEEEAQVACLAELTLRELSHRDTSRHAAPFARALASGKPFAVCGSIKRPTPRP